MSAARSATNGWTGGQYSLYRFSLAAVLLALFARVPFLTVAPADTGIGWLGPRLPALAAALVSPLASWLIVAAALVCCLLLAAGLRDRGAAVLLWLLGALLLAARPMIWSAGHVILGWLLLAHALTPPAPYLSWAARGRPDPGAGWNLPSSLHRAAWLLLAAVYALFGAGRFLGAAWVPGPGVGDSTLGAGLAGIEAAQFSAGSSVGAGLLALTEIGIAALLLIRPIRRWIWLPALLFEGAWLCAAGEPVAAAALALLHLLGFDPAWIPPARSASAGRAPRPDRIFFDGNCGLCHRSVRFALAEDRHQLFRFAPLGGAAFVAELAAERREELPDSLVVVPAGGRALVLSAAVLHMARRLGGLWRLLAGLASWVPRALRDPLYRAIARVRHRLFTSPKEVCPLMTAEQRARFDP